MHLPLKTATRSEKWPALPDIPTRGTAAPDPIRKKYSAKTVEIAPSAEARMIVSSAQPKRKAGSDPNASRKYEHTAGVR